MGDAVGFQKTEVLFVPDFALDGNVRAQEAARLGAAQTVWSVGALGAQQPIQRGGAHCAQQMALAGRYQLEVFVVMRQPQRQGLDESFAARLFGTLPDALHQRPDRRVTRRRATGFVARGRWQCAGQQLDGVFAGVTVLLAQFVQQTALAFFAAPGVTGAQSLQMCFDIELLHFHASIYGVISL